MPTWKIATTFLLAIFLTLMTGACSTIGGRNQDQTEEAEVSFNRITSFDGQVLTIDLGAADLETTEEFPVLTTARHAQNTAEYLTPIPGHLGRGWNLLRTGDDGTSLGYALVSWNNEDPTDYLAGGWWIEFREQHPPNLDVWDFDRNSYIQFVDGPEIDPSNPPEFPVEGQATYSGNGGGAFLYRYGTDWGDFEGTLVQEEYAATVTVNVDFSQNTLQGCLGCEGDVVTRRSYLTRLLEEVLGEAVNDIEVAVADYELHFNVTPFNPDGTFLHTDVAVVHPERTITSVGGQWAGNLSNRPDAAGHPRLVTGLNSVRFQEADGSRGHFLGIFLSLSEPFSRSRGPEQATGSGSGR